MSFSGFTAADFELLGGLTGELNLAGELDDRTDELWAKARRSVGELGSRLFGDGRCHADLWPEGDGDDGDRGPFLWARLKRTGNERFATHIGVFISPDLCNLAIDVEKDLLDTGQSGESLEQVIEFCRSELGSMLGTTTGGDLQVWTDTHNVVAAADFEAVDFAVFMKANRDADHPWPKIGYTLSADDVEGFGNHWVEEYRARAASLVAVYDAMIRRFAG